MTKTFKIAKNKELHVTIELENDVFIPVGEEKVKIGKYKQLTVQMIKPDRIKDLKVFITAEKTRAVTQLDQLKVQWDEVKDLQDIDDEIIKHCKLGIQKGSKAFKKDMEVLNKRIMDLNKKAGLKAQIEYIEKQVGDMSDDLDRLIKAIK